MLHVFLLFHTHDLDDAESSKLIGVYTSEALARSAIARLVALPGFVDFPDSFVIDRYELDQDNWTEGFITAVALDVPLLDGGTTPAQATRLFGGLYQLWPCPDESVARWAFQPGDSVRCELRTGPNGSERLVAVELASPHRNTR